MAYHSHFEMKEENRTKILASEEEVSSAVLYQYPYSKFHQAKTISLLWAKLDDMTGYFRTVMIVCTWIVNISVLLQITVAVLILIKIKKVPLYQRPFDTFFRRTNSKFSARQS
jgi:hypothetical protein